MDPSNLIKPAIEIASKAGDAIMSFYQGDRPMEIVKKDDNTPVTAADIRSNEIICEELSKLTPDIPVLSEEGPEVSFEERQTWETYWLIDPLDATREFINGTGEFCINIALIREHAPILGIIFSPVNESCYTACLGDDAKYLNKNGESRKIHVSSWLKSEPVRVIVSRTAIKDRIKLFCEHLGRYELLTQGSALKFCRIAEGDADIYPRFGPFSVRHGNEKIKSSSTPY